MSSFTAARWEPTGEKSEGRPVYAIRGEAGDGFRFYIGFKGSTLSVHVPEGFLTDGPSIPGFVRWAIPKSVIEACLKSSAVHDLLCEDPRFTRLAADAIFLTAMEAEGTPPFWREVFFRAVRTNDSKARRNPDEIVLPALSAPECKSL
ncbi:MAG: DUF1353 domain-containing protein [Phenylobacterium sp.]|uniref:DUF1353 domain-containing protein n=1 Tax=Phenylobacterium sp. TaxID=1871053 RepID=UPI00391C9720